jgi:hypothetical protein
MPAVISVPLKNTRVELFSDTYTLTFFAPLGSEICFLSRRFSEDFQNVFTYVVLLRGQGGEPVLLRVPKPAEPAEYPDSDAVGFLNVKVVSSEEFDFTNL